MPSGHSLLQELIIVCLRVKNFSVPLVFPPPPGRSGHLIRDFKMSTRVLLNSVCTHLYEYLLEYEIEITCRKFIFLGSGS
jgi:hypothetical protein